jgi:hypothetical protein
MLILNKEYEEVDKIVKDEAVLIRHLLDDRLQLADPLSLIQSCSL